jgi:hypothetical protein
MGVKRKLTKEGQRAARILRGIAGCCLICGYKENLVIHHELPLSKGGEDKGENLDLVCPNCHAALHSGKTPNQIYKVHQRQLQTIVGLYEKFKKKGKGRINETIWGEIRMVEFVPPQQIGEAINFCFGERNAI